jgi:hypothetical protein
MEDLAKYGYGKIGKGTAVHIVFDGKALCNSSQTNPEKSLSAKDVTCKRCINPMYKYKPYNDLLAFAEKGQKTKKRKSKENENDQLT